MVLLGFLDPKDPPELQVRRGSRADSSRPGLTLLPRRVPQAPLASPGRLGPLDRQETPGLKGQKGGGGHSGLQDYQDHRGQQDQMETQETEAHWGREECWDPRGSPALSATLAALDQ